MYIRADRYKAILSDLTKNMTKADRDSLRLLIGRYETRKDIDALLKLRHQVCLAGILISGTMEEACDKVSALMQMDHITVQKGILNALADMPSDWQAAERERLYDKGLIFGATRFHVARDPLTKGDDFDAVRRHLPAIAAPIMDTALECSYFKKNSYGWAGQDRALLYVAIQLLEDGPYKAQWMQIIRERNPSHAHQVALRSSYTGIQKIAAGLGISLSCLPHLEEAAAPKRQPRKMTGTMAEAAAGDPVERPQDHAQIELQTKLNALLRQGDITEKARDVFAFAASIGYEGRFEQKVRVQSYFTRQVGPKGSQPVSLRLDDLQEIMQNVSEKLDRYNRLTKINGQSIDFRP